ncbi:Gamma-glutamyltranspeptidase (EC @ Glutathione hydrolase (EC [Olavius sp. associated proteobacterium Delta 1]|nr:Gamma-glutamyltranspeptidase (EC @ Glutathione hydrolase (EC [Olavius sp. associated proteobacterium Delta 1]
MTISWQFPYPSQRMPVLARNLVATSQPLAAQAGLRMLLKGGNAVDAALATAITLTVVEPTSNGIGSDAFALVWDGETLHGLNGSGRSPRAWTLDRFAGSNQMPIFGWDAVTVPGAVDSWVQLSQKFGKLPFGDLFGPAIDYAQNGFVVSPFTAVRWAATPELYADFPDFGKTFLPGGQAPGAGERFSCPDQAQTLKSIAASRGESFYRGDLARKIVNCAASNGGAMTLEDLANHRSRWVQSISTEYRGVHLHQIPPNGQGLAALMALGLLRNFDLQQYPADSADSIHLQVEAMKIALAEAYRHIADSNAMLVNPEELLAQEFLHARAQEIDIGRASHPGSKILSDQGTVYLTAADDSGMLVSFIQSNYYGFGSGVVIPQTGISMQNRGFGFVLEPGHPNCVAGSKRPFHTIIPGFVTRDGQALMSFGVMGGSMQAQGHVQMMVRIFDYNQNPQAACDAPRWHVDENFQVALEPGTAPDVISDLKDRGQKIMDAPPSHLFGGAQLIYALDDGYCAASDHRKDGQAVGY